MRPLLLLLFAFATTIASAEFLDVDCDGLVKACCDGENFPGENRQLGDVGDDAKSGCTTFGRKKKECANRGNIACCGVLHDTIGTQCKAAEDRQIKCAEPALANRKHKRWSLPLKRALFQKRGDWCDEQAAAQQWQDFNAKYPLGQGLNNIGFPDINRSPLGRTFRAIQELSKSNDKGTKSYPGSIIDPAPFDLAPAVPADGGFDDTSNPYGYFQKEF